MGKLHPIVNDTNGRVWCGPGAIASIAGLPLSTVKEAIYAWRGRRRPIMGMSNREVCAVLAHFGWQIKTRKVYPLQQPTLARWIRERPKDQVNAVALVNITGHYVVVAGRKFNDNCTMEPVFTSKARKRRSRVKAAWTFSQI